MSPDRVVVRRPDGSLGKTDPNFRLSFVEHGIPLVAIAVSIAGAAFVFAWFASGEALGVKPSYDLASEPEPWSVRNNRRRRRAR